MDDLQEGERYVRGETPAIGSPQQRWAWAQAGSDGCTILHRPLAGIVFIRIHNHRRRGDWELEVPVDRFLEEWRRFE